MDIQTLLDQLEASSVAQFMQTSAWAFPTVESIHVIAITIVFGVIAIVDLRLLGVASRSRRFTEVARDCLHWTWAAFGLAVISGCVMFATNAHTYFDNGWFRLKMLFLLLAGINMLVFELITVRSVAQWDDGTATLPNSVRVAGFLSISFWIAVIVCGRWIGFTLFSAPI